MRFLTVTLRVTTFLLAGSGPAWCQIPYSFSDLTLDNHWIQIMATRGAGGTATVTKGSPGVEAHYQIDLTVNPGSATSSVAEVLINTDATFSASAAGLSIGSLNYSELSANFRSGIQLSGPALRQNGKIYVLWNLTAPGANNYTANSKANITSVDLAELRTDGRWLDYGSHPDFSASAATIEFGFWRASELPGSSGGGGGYCGMYICGPSGSPSPVTTSYGVQRWSVTLTLNTIPLPDAGSQSTSTTSNSGDSTDPVFPGTGEYYDTIPEISLGGPLPLQFILYYGSLLRASGFSGALAANWTHNFEVSLAQDARATTVRLFRGRRISFSKTTAGLWQLTTPAQYPYQLLSASGGFRFYDPSQNLIYTFDGNGALTRIEDRNGNALTVTRSVSSPGPDRVSDGLGRSLTFTYSSGKLARVEDQKGRSVVFSYTGDNLTGVTGTNGKTTRYTYSSGGLLTSKTVPTGATPLTQSFDARGRVVRQTDGMGFSATLAYDTPNAGATTVVNPLGAVFQYSYQGQANLVGQTDPAGQGATFAYDNNNRLLQAIDRIGGKKLATYDPVSGRVATEADALGAITKYAYSAQTQAGFTFYNLTQVTRPDGSSGTFSFDAAGNIVASTDLAGKTTRFTRNARGQPLTVTNPAGGVTTYTYNDDGTLASLQTPGAGITSYSYDDKKRLSKITLPDQTARTLSYDDAGNVVREVNEAGRQDSYTYDDNNQVASIASQAATASAIAHDPNQRVSSFAAPGVKAQSLGYDGAGRLKSILTPTGETVSLSFDQQHRLTAVNYCSSKGLGFGYDNEGRIASMTDGSGNAWLVSSDKAGNITQIKSPLGRQFQYTYDTAGRLASFTDPASRTAKFSRDAAGRLISIAAPGGAQISQTRNDLGLPISLTDINGNTWQWTYDAAGRRTSSADPLQRAVSYQLDARGRTAQIGFAEGSAQLSHDGAGHLTRRLYSGGLDLNFTYDTQGRPLTANGVSLAYGNLGKMIRSNGIDIARDDGFHISSINYAPGKTVQYTYDCNGLVTSVSDWAGGGATFTYGNSRELLSIQRSNGVTTQYGYDAEGRLTEISENGGAASSIALSRNAAGDIVSANRNIPQAPSPASGSVNFSYDAASQVGGASYDSLGRPLGLWARNYTWDPAGRLTAYSGDDGAATFGYDAYGMRTSRSSGGVTQTFVINYALARPAVSIVRQDGADLRYYIYLPDGRLLYSLDASDSSPRFYHFDEAGSTLFLTGDDGSITDSYAITPYGEQVDHTGASDNPFTFLGQYGVAQESATGLYYMGFRYYDSVTARFLTRAPGVEPDLKHPNLYQYAKSNPLAFVDPMGQGPHAGRGASLNEGSDFAKLVLSLPEMFWPRERADTRLIPAALVRELLGFAAGEELRKDTKP